MVTSGTPHERMTLALMERIDQLEDKLEEETRKTSEAVAELHKLKSSPTKSTRKKPAPRKRQPVISYPEPEYVCDGVYRVYSPKDGTWKWFSED